MIAEFSQASGRQDRGHIYLTTAPQGREAGVAKEEDEREHFMQTSDTLRAAPPQTARAAMHHDPEATDPEVLGTQAIEALQMVDEVIRVEGNQQAGSRSGPLCDACGNPTIPGPANRSEDGKECWVCHTAMEYRPWVYKCRQCVTIVCVECTRQRPPDWEETQAGEARDGLGAGEVVVEVRG